MARLDGLPLAVELAAARIRTMSVEEVRRALADRFALLRGRDRTAPARHQTLTSVIGWSWDLLSTDEQRALAWLSVFHDGFSADAASAVLGPDGADLVEALVDQSLLTVSEEGGVVRYRMLETVREFGGQRLAEAGGADAGAGRPDPLGGGPAPRRCDRRSSGRGRSRRWTISGREEGNLTDILRGRLAGRRRGPRRAAARTPRARSGRSPGTTRASSRSPTWPSGCSSTSTRPRSWCR